MIRVSYIQGSNKVSKDFEYMCEAQNYYNNTRDMLNDAGLFDVASKMKITLDAEDWEILLMK